MNSPAIKYAKLPGGSWTIEGRSWLWLAPDHLLEVHALFFSERYHRFPLADLGALVVQRTRTGFYLNIACGITAAVALVSAGGVAWGFQHGAKQSVPPEMAFLMWFMVVPLGLVALAALIALFCNTLLGPTCHCVLHTPAGPHRLGAPRRLRAARRLLARLAPAVEAAQSDHTSTGSLAREAALAPLP